MVERNRLKGLKVIGCPVCWGKKKICIGLRDNLEPTLEPCTGCDGYGYIAYKTIDKKKCGTTMPQVGEIKNGREIGYKSDNGYIWQACADCGKERWVQLRRGQRLSSKRCRECCGRQMGRAAVGFGVGEKNSNWKGGRMETRKGYILVKLYPDDFFYSMTDKDGYVSEHRLVVAKALGRNLHRWEIVHHKHDRYPRGSKEDKADNRYPENLQLVSDDRHTQITILENRIGRLEDKVSKQAAIIECLKRDDATGWIAYKEVERGSLDKVKLALPRL